MFDSHRSQIPRPEPSGGGGEGATRMLSRLQRQDVGPAELDLCSSAWADTCPGSFDRLWNPEPRDGDAGAHEEFAATLTMALSDL